MPKTTKTKPELKTSLGEKRSKNRPLTALFLLTLSILLFASLFDYSPSQSHYIDSNANHFSRNAVGDFGAFTGFWFYRIFGIAAWLVPLCLLRLSFLCIAHKGHFYHYTRVLAMCAALIALAGIGNMLQFGFFANQYTSATQDIQSALNPSNPYFIHSSGHGGLIGDWLYANMMREAVGPFGSGLIYGMLFMFSAAWAFIAEPREQFSKLSSVLKKSTASYITMLKEAAEKRKEAKAAAAQEQKPVEATIDTPKKSAPRKATIVSLESEEPKATPKPKPEKIEIETPKPEPRVTAKKIEPAPKPQDQSLKIVQGEKVEKAQIKQPSKPGDYQFPPIEMLASSEGDASPTHENYEETADALVETLSQFKVDVQLGEVLTGPVITRYEVTPAPGVRVEKIESLDKNIALGLRAEAVRILAPVPGKGTVGIEVPNRIAAPVRLREIIESRAWADVDADIPIVLGKEVTGKPVVVDLTKMPHMLIAGATGAGKTVCINAVIASLLYKMSPADLRFIMVDPKVVEMQGYNDLPHMLVPVVTEPKKVPGALKYLIKEMEHRFQVFAEVGVRNIAGFNAKILKDKTAKAKADAMEAELTPEERTAMDTIDVPKETNIDIPKEKLPYIVCIIDELADLMMVAPADIEHCVARLAQLARAAGIHLILATQRPSVNVITGVIKANLPTRIAFKVASNTDSRTILDSKGAEALIGKGDMLFTPPGKHTLVRAQGAFVSDEEISALVDYVHDKNGAPSFDETVQNQIESESEDGGSGNDSNGEWDDELVPQAIDVIRNSKRASTSMLQRRLKIGYNRAARIMELLEDEGIVGPENGSSPREILQDLD